MRERGQNFIAPDSGESDSGMTAAPFGTVPAAAIGAIGTLLAALLWMRPFTRLRDTDGFEVTPTASSASLER